MAPQPAKNNTILYVLLGFFGFFFLSLIFVVLAVGHFLGHSGGNDLLAGSSEITMIEIQGPIFQSEDIVRRIRRFKKSDKKALLLRINSPGGAVAPSQEIYDEVLRAREAKKIVVASMSSVGASGAYYIASACDKIVADPGTLTGSIGVIAEFPDASGLLKKVGLQYEVVKSGKFKDTGFFGRPMTPEDRKYLQDTINDIFGQFLDAVVQGRKAAMKEKLAALLHKKSDQVTDGEVKNYILPYADGRGLTGKKAFELGFIDKLGNYDDAVQLTADLAGIKGEPTVRWDRPSRFDQFVDGLLPFSVLAGTGYGPQLEYLAF